MMMHPDFRALLDAYTPDELASIFREELEALQIPYTTNSSENSYFSSCSQTFINIAHSSRFFIILHESSYAL